MDSILNLIQNSSIIKKLQGKNNNFVTDDVIGVSLMFSGLFLNKPDNYLIVASNLYNAQKISDRISSLIGEDNVLLFPNDELLRAENLSSNKELLSQRLYVLTQIALSNKPHIVVCHTSSLLRYLPNPKLFKERCFKLEINTKYNIEELEKILIKSGYLKVNKIDQSLQFARRGDILDVFPINEQNPIRISFFDDEIDRISIFDIATQSSIRNIKEIYITPASDLLLTDNEYDDIEDKLLNRYLLDKTRLDNRYHDSLFIHVNDIIFSYQNYLNKSNQYKYYSYLQKDYYSIVDYALWDNVFITNKGQFEISIDLLFQEVSSFIGEQIEEGKILSHLELFLNPQRVLASSRRVLYNHSFSLDNSTVSYQVRPIVMDGHTHERIISTILTYINAGNKIILSVENKNQEETIYNLLKENLLDYEIIDNNMLPKGLIGVGSFSFIEGFELVDEKLVVISPKELFGYASHHSRFHTRFKEAIILKSSEDLKPGDYIVHENYGIGQFIDVVTKESNGHLKDYLYIAYAKEDKLYVPLSNFKLVRKFSGREGVAPKLSSLSGGEWKKTKERIAKKVSDLAERLIKLYKERMLIKGIAFNKDDEFQYQFENEFPFELTDDQANSLREIKLDMESEQAMDRLLCGDVGFGKTEIAFRAAFKAINSGKQVALLCPTTLLARQHYEVALNRFNNFGINIAILSRLIPQAKQNKYIKDIKDGKIHLVIGTHKLLSKSVMFKDLGLLIVDEEQRFGVAQKEIIKELKNSLDVLTLSATPIPRTLQMSLVGVRTLSQINTAPRNRVAVQTYVTPYNESVIKELIEKELSRNGQTFYVYNNVTHIYSKASKLSRLVPSANIGVVHGQMEKEEIEDVMMKFYSGEINLLICTSVVENGIDVPNANMIIVENADRFGLSQLYQIKGRVGRGDRIAYAYFMFRNEKTLTESAVKRLKAIQDFTELGSGYKIAQRDLMIRGAGDILGSEQAGFIDTIGMDLYLKMLNDSIKEKTGEKKIEEVKPSLVLNIGGYIPEEYANKSDKIELYQEIGLAKTHKELEIVNNKIKDIYGRLPEEVSLLIAKKRIEILLSTSIFDGIQEFPTSVDITLSKNFSSRNGIANALFDKLYPLIRKIKVTYRDRVIKIKLIKHEFFLNDLEDLLNKIIEVAEENIPEEYLK